MFGFIVGVLVGWFCYKFKAAILGLFSRAEKKVESTINNSLK